MLEETEERFSFNVTRCRYAEMYLQLGIPEMGALPPATFMEPDGGVQPAAALTRTQTIMGGAEYCDFRHVLGSKGE